MCKCENLRSVGIRNFALVCEALQREQYGLILQWARDKAHYALDGHGLGWQADAWFTQRVGA